HLGHTELCNGCKSPRRFDPAAVADEYDEGCRSACIGCVDHKDALADALIEYLEPIARRRNNYRQRQDEVRDILMEGVKRAREEAGLVMGEVRRAMKINWV